MLELLSGYFLGDRISFFEYYKTRVITVKVVTAIQLMKLHQNQSVYYLKSK